MQSFSATCRGIAWPQGRLVSGQASRLDQTFAIRDGNSLRAIAGERIVEVGGWQGHGRLEIDASGLPPGWVDVFGSLPSVAACWSALAWARRHGEEFTGAGDVVAAGAAANPSMQRDVAA